MPTPEKSKDNLRIFVLADTHNRLPETIREIAKDADEIWHLGDVCTETILDELRAIGPQVTVVRGNCDSNYEWPLVVDVPRNERRGSVLYLNPGCVTRANQGAPPSVAWLEIANGKISWKLIPLR
jgi:uncharacterized protein